MEQSLTQKKRAWENEGYIIDCFDINQRDNGYTDEVEKGILPETTYTIIVLTSEEVELFAVAGYSTPEEALSDGISFLENKK